MRMMASLGGAVVALALAAGARAADPPTGGGGCVACHRASAHAPSLEHTFEDWAGSRHARAGVYCTACHGGDASRATRVLGHVGVVSSTVSASSTYFTALPATCGACHAAEYEAFRRSRHYDVLMKTGRGPSCVSCHGAMANYVISPKEMEMACTLCHREPTRAFEARVAVDDARDAVLFLDGVDAGRAAELRARLGRLLVEWHSFDAVKVREEARRIERDAAAAVRERALRP